MLCTFALKAYAKYGTRNDVVDASAQRGLLINYDSLPGSIPAALLPLFGATISKEWLAKMNLESQHYSKSRGVSFRLFFGDSSDKEQRATAAIQEYAQSILAESFDQLNAKALEGFKNFLPGLHAVWDGAEGGGRDANWTSIKALPTDVRQLTTGAEAADGGEGEAVDASSPSLAKHSSPLKPKSFSPWAPFSNRHSSKTFEVSVRIALTFYEVKTVTS